MRLKNQRLLRLMKVTNVMEIRSAGETFDDLDFESKNTNVDGFSIVSNRIPNETTMQTMQTADKYF